jgi:hypothetical protein
LGQQIFSLPLLGSLAAALTGGFFIDIDHLFDYFLSFGRKFKLGYFLKGYQFLKSDKIYVILHSCELSLIIVLLAISLNNYLLFIAAVSHFCHLIADLWINHLPCQFYLLINRLKNHFNLKPLVSNKHFQKHQKLKQIINL